MQTSYQKEDIRNEQDIIRLVDEFYKKVNADELLSPVFNDIAQVNWEHHLPRMYEFWNSLLLYTGSYKGSPFPKHEVLPITPQHFRRWLELFAETLTELFEGENTVIALNKAQNIALTFQAKMGLLEQDGEA